MTILQDMTRAVEGIVREPIKDDYYMIGPRELAALLSHAALARQSLDRIAKSGLTDALAELLWKAEMMRAIGLSQNVPWEEAGEYPRKQFRGLAQAVLLSGLV